MRARVAACAAWAFAWSVWAGLDGGALPYPGIAVAMAQEVRPELAQKTAQQQAPGAPRQGVQIAMRPEGIRPAPANKPAPQALPFGLAAERVSEGKILHKWIPIGNSGR